MAAAAFSLALVLAVPGGTAGATSSHAKTVKISTDKIAGVGTVLTTASGLTLYRFAEDKPGSSACTGACAKIWPPLLASKGAHVSGPKGVKGLSLMNVGDGHWQVAFHKLPLYRFEGDTKKGQDHGQNVGKVWFAVLKSGVPASALAGAGAGAGAAAGATTTAPSASTTQPMTSTTSGSGSSSANATTPTQARTPATQPPTPATQPPPPSTTPPTSPPPPTTTTTAGSGGYGY